MRNAGEEREEELPVSQTPDLEVSDPGLTASRSLDQREYSRKRTRSERTRAGRASPGRSTEKRTTRWNICLMIILCCLIGAAAGLWFSQRGKLAAAESKLVYEANVISGDIPGKTPEERQRELNSQVADGMLNMSMNITPSGRVNGSDADRSINWLIENPSNQGKLIRVEITRDDTGEKIYETGAIRPGNYVEAAPPDVRLEAGEYPCTAVFYAYEEETERLIGQAAVKIKLTLQE